MNQGDMDQIIAEIARRGLVMRNPAPVQSPMFSAKPAPSRSGAGFFTGVTAGTYTFPSTITVDAKGRLTEVVAGDGAPSVGEVPSGYIELASSQTTTSGVLVDIPTMTLNITIVTTAHVRGIMTWDAESTGGGTNATIACAVSVNGVDGQEIDRFLSGTNDMGAGASQYRTAAALAPGTYVVKGRFRRTAGNKTVRVTKAQLFGEGLEAA